MNVCVVLSVSLLLIGATFARPSGHKLREKSHQRTSLLRELASLMSDREVSQQDVHQSVFDSLRELLARKLLREKLARMQLLERIPGGTVRPTTIRRTFPPFTIRTPPPTTVPPPPPTTTPPPPPTTTPFVPRITTETPTTKMPTTRRPMPVTSSLVTFFPIRPSKRPRIKFNFARILKIVYKILKCLCHPRKYRHWGYYRKYRGYHG